MIDELLTSHRRMITHDIQQFSNSLAAIYANVAKPILDMFIYNYQLSQNVGAEGLFILTMLMQGSTVLCKQFGTPSPSALLINVLQYEL